MYSFKQPRSLTLLVVSLMLAVVAAPVFGKTASPAPAAAKSLPPKQVPPSHDYDVLHIKLNLHFDWAREEAIGVEEFTFKPTAANFRRLDLDATNMTVNSVKLAAGGSLTFALDKDHQKLRVKLDRDYQPAETVTVVVDYHTDGPTEDSKTGFGGLVFIQPNPADPARYKQIWTEGESEFNHQWFPCWDHPNDFATTEIIATVEKPLTVIANGRLVDQQDNPDGTRTFHWSMEQPHASYLTSIVVGEFAAVEDDSAGVPVISYVYPDEVEAGRTTSAEVPDMIKFFAERTGVPFPYAKYGQAFVYGFDGGMENITATTMTDTLVRDKRSQLDGPDDGTVAHELAHSWFGDDLTCAWWSDIWLNESFATYFQQLWDEHRLGENDFLYRDVLDNERGYLRAWKSGSRRPVVTSNYKNPDGLFDTYAYPRGAAVLHMLRTMLGDETWLRAVRLYVQKYPHQPVMTDQLREAAEEASGQQLAWFFDQWVYRMGHPILRVTQQYDATAKKLTLTVKQEQKTDSGNPYPQTALFKAPVEVEIVEAGQPARIERVTLEAKREQTFSFKSDTEPVIVDFDRGSTLVKELQFEKLTPALVRQLREDPDVTGRLWALQELHERGAKDKGVDAAPIRAAVAEALVKDEFWGVRLEAADTLKAVGSDGQQEALVAATKDPDARVRAAVIRALASTKDAKFATVYLGLLDDQSYDVIEEAATALGQTHDPGAFEALSKLAETPSWHDNIRASALIGLAALGDVRALPLAKRYAALGNRLNVRAAATALLGSTAGKDPDAYPLISSALTQALEIRSQELWQSAAAALVATGDHRAAEACTLMRQRFKDPEESEQISALEKQLKKKQEQACGGAH